MLTFRILWGIIFILFSSSFALAEDLTITSYYPSPYGKYQELTAYKAKVGSNYSGATYGVSTDNLAVEGRVGIGTTSPNAQLQVKGSGAADWISLGVSSGTVNISSGTGKNIYVAKSSGYGQTFSGNSFQTETLTLGYQGDAIIATEGTNTLTIDAGGTGKTIIQDNLGIRKSPSCALDVSGTICTNIINSASSALSVTSTASDSISATSIGASGSITASGDVSGQDIKAGDEMCLPSPQGCRTSWSVGCTSGHTSHDIYVDEARCRTFNRTRRDLFECPANMVFRKVSFSTIPGSSGMSFTCCYLSISA